jgi:adenylate kinase
LGVIFLCFLEMNYVFIWIQGSGKWTQARLLEENFDFRLYESGGALRVIAQEESSLWKQVKETIDRWDHVSPEIIENIMTDILENKLDRTHAIFDGFVRNIGNKSSADRVLWDYKVVLFELSEDKARTRLLWRMYNPTTWQTFQAWTTKDPQTGETLIKRADDEENAILKRIALYVDLALPLIEEYRNEGKLIVVNADQSIEKVFAELQEKLGLK